MRALTVLVLTAGRDRETATRVFKPGDTSDYGAQLINNTTRDLKREVRLYRDGDPAGHFPPAAFALLGMATWEGDRPGGPSHITWRH